ncbi:stage II sporulation protein M [Paenibacillus sacheonensis]|uniref:Stage II sporulation protein M n=1 Tax=Paenibacillus sacheonensis TaxID=742054 RepID=A0A7X5BXT8_9BACL|nr:stage II sporulation protein M [Paenibacillus sacheonensis]MBM7564410.1 stage II sporulation protein M [Paenibacillus sacheonensis]NBC68972.1 stage II sporulation protein M [Paenibacillus sacheonensis]
MRTSALQSSAKDQLSLYVFVFVLFVVGVVFGALMINALTLGQQQDLSDDVQQFILHIQNGTLQQGSDTFADRAWFQAKWLLLVWVLGLTVVGMPFVLALDFLKGVLVGFAIGMLVREFAWKGLVFSLASVAPVNLIAVPAFLIASVAAVTFAAHVVKSRFLGRFGSLGRPLLTFTATAAVMLVLLIAAALIESYLTPILLRWAAPLVDGAAPGLESF